MLVTLQYLCFNILALVDQHMSLNKNRLDWKWVVVGQDRINRMYPCEDKINAECINCWIKLDPKVFSRQFERKTVLYLISCYTSLTLLYNSCWDYVTFDLWFESMTLWKYEYNVLRKHTTSLLNGCPEKVECLRSKHYYKLIYFY